MSKFILLALVLFAFMATVVLADFTAEVADTLAYLIEDLESELADIGVFLDDDQDFDMRAINNRGLDLIKSFEGFRSCPYKDVAGYPTIGYGHLIKKGEKFGCLTKAQATTLLKKDVHIAESCVASAVKVRLNDNQFAALTSFTFNLGCGSLRSSTLLKLLNQGKYGNVCSELARWNKAGGRVVQGLVRRRSAECALFKA